MLILTFYESASKNFTSISYLSFQNSSCILFFISDTKSNNLQKSSLLYRISIFFFAEKLELHSFRIFYTLDSSLFFRFPSYWYHEKLISISSFNYLFPLFIVGSKNNVHFATDILNLYTFVGTYFHHTIIDLNPRIHF